MKFYVAPAALIIGAIATPLAAALPAGSTAPAIRTSAALAGKVVTFDLAAALKRGPVVLYFYPAAFTQGCTLETREFAERHADFAKAGATVVGISNDDLPTLVKFSREACRDKFAVAVATPQTIADYDVKLTNSPRSSRTSYVIARNGKVAFAYAAMDYREHVSKTLAAVQQLDRAK